jgi:hypothetical protein
LLLGFRSASRSTAFRIKSRSGSRGVYKLIDKGMEIENDYEKDVFNEDIGRISGIDLEEQGVTSEVSQIRTSSLGERTLSIQERVGGIFPPSGREEAPRLRRRRKLLSL